MLKESILLRVKAKDTSPPSGALNILKFTPGELNIYIQNPNENRDDLMNKLTAGTVEVENQKQKTSPLNRIAQRSWAAQCKRKKSNHVFRFIYSVNSRNAIRRILFSTSYSNLCDNNKHNITLEWCCIKLCLGNYRHAKLNQ